MHRELKTRACLSDNRARLNDHVTHVHTPIATCVHAYVDTRKVSVNKCTPPLAQMRHPALVSVPLPSIIANHVHQN